MNPSLYDKQRVLHYKLQHSWEILPHWKRCLYCPAKDTDNEVYYISTRKRNSCIKWVSNTNFVEGNTVAIAACHLNGAQRPCYVGRLKSPTNTLPGKYHLGSYGPEGVWTVFNGQGYTTGTMELYVHSDSQVTWVPPTARDPVPFGAIVGGYLSSSDSKLYILRGMVQYEENAYTVIG